MGIIWYELIKNKTHFILFLSFDKNIQIITVDYHEVIVKNLFVCDID